MTDRQHPIITRSGQEFANGKLDRREFLRIATLLGIAAPVAYSMAGLPAPALAQGTPKKGGIIRIGMRVQDLKSPHTYSWIEGANAGRQVLDYLTFTGVDNVTRPNLVAKWDASPDLKTWTFTLRNDITWRKGRKFTADDAVWNLKRMLDPKTGSSMVGLVKGFMMKDVELDEIDPKTNAKKKSAVLWDASAITKVDDFTFRLTGQSPNLGIPEALFHYPALMMDPEENGVFQVGSNGTGAFEMVELEVGKRAVFVNHKKPHWGGGAHIDRLEVIDLGEDAATSVGALASKQVDMLYQGAISTLPVVEKLPHITINSVDTGYTATARVHSIKPFDDKRVRQALRLAIDYDAVLKIAHRGLGKVGDQHHVSPAHPEYSSGVVTRDVAKAKALLAEAGYPNGIDTEIAARPAPDWELLAVQTMVEHWKEAGIRVKINVMPSAQYWDVWTKVPFGFTTWAHRPLGTMVLGLAYRTGAAWNESKWSNAEFDKLITEAEGYLDVAKRKAVIEKIGKIMLDDGPVVVPLWRAVFNYTDKKIKGYKIHPSIYIEAKEMWIDA
jgi:peptide/nickel transport system substrate-binding protein